VDAAGTDHVATLDSLPADLPKAERQGFTAVSAEGERDAAAW
jgi:hypothetical protein